MNINKQIKNRSIYLRLHGRTYSEINSILPKKVPKSTLSVWFKDLKFTKVQKQALDKNILNKIQRAQKLAVKIVKIRRKEKLNKLKVKNEYLLPLINLNTQKIMLSILYLGEGSKSKSSQSLNLGSTNPKIIQLYLTLLTNCFKTDKSKFRVRIQCRSDQNIELLESYWQNITKIPRKQFYPTYIDKRTIGKPTIKHGYKGVCVITYFDRSIQYEIEFLYESMIKYLLMGR